MEFQHGQNEAKSETTSDRLLDGRLTLHQPRLGYRAGADAALLAAACDAGEGQTVLEPGCGVGAALISAAWRRPHAAFVGLERDPGALALVERNILDNALQARVRAQAGDVRERPSALGLEPFDAVIANPPYFDDPSAIRGPAPQRAGAYLADGGLQAWTRFMLKAVREGGSITMIHRADRLGDILSLLSAGGGSFRVRPIHPFPDAPAKRVLVRAIKTGKAPLILLPPLVLHDRSSGKHTDQAEGLFRGERALSWA